MRISRSERDPLLFGKRVPSVHHRFVEASRIDLVILIVLRMLETLPVRFQAIEITLLSGRVDGLYEWLHNQNHPAIAVRVTASIARITTSLCVFLSIPRSLHLRTFGSPYVLLPNGKSMRRAQRHEVATASAVVPTSIADDHGRTAVTLVSPVARPYYRREVELRAVLRLPLAEREPIAADVLRAHRSCLPTIFIGRTLRCSSPRPGGYRSPRQPPARHGRGAGSL